MWPLDCQSQQGDFKGQGIWLELTLQPCNIQVTCDRRASIHKCYGQSDFSPFVFFFFSSNIKYIWHSGPLSSRGIGSVYPSFPGHYFFMAAPNTVISNRCSWLIFYLMGSVAGENHMLFVTNLQRLHFSLYFWGKCKISERYFFYMSRQVPNISCFKQWCSHIMMTDKTYN